MCGSSASDGNGSGLCSSGMRGSFGVVIWLTRSCVEAYARGGGASTGGMLDRASGGSAEVSGDCGGDDDGASDGCFGFGVIFSTTFFSADTTFSTNFSFAR